LEGKKKKEERRVFTEKGGEEKTKRGRGGMR